MSTTSISNCDITVKVLLVGDPSVGKSSLLWRMCENIHPSVEQANITIAQTHKTKAIPFSGKKQIVVKFIDTVGQERFRTISRSLYSNTDVVILTFDPTNRSSFERLQQWNTEVERYARNPKLYVALASTKSDLISSSTTATTSGTTATISTTTTATSSNNNNNSSNSNNSSIYNNNNTGGDIVSVAEAQQFAQSKGIIYIQTSSVSGTGVEDLLYTVVKGAGEKLYADENWTKFKPKSTVRSPTLLGTFSSSFQNSFNGSSSNTNNSSSNNNSNNSNNNNSNSNSPQNNSPNNNNTTNNEKKSSFCTIFKVTSCRMNSNNVISLDDDDDDFKVDNNNKSNNNNDYSNTNNGFIKKKTTTTTTNANKSNNVAMSLESSLDAIDNDDFEDEIEMTFTRDEPKKRKKTTKSTAAASTTSRGRQTKKQAVNTSSTSILDYEDSFISKKSNNSALDLDDYDDDFKTPAPTTSTSTLAATAASKRTMKPTTTTSTTSTTRGRPRQLQLDDSKPAKKKSKKEALKETSIHFDSELPPAEIDDLLSMMTEKCSDIICSDLKQEKLSIDCSIQWKRSLSNGKKEDQDIIVLRYSPEFLYRMAETNTLITTISNLLDNYPTKRFILLIESLDYFLKQKSQMKSADITSKLNGSSNQTSSTTTNGSSSDVVCKKFFSRHEFEKIFLEIQYKYSTIMVRIVNNRSESSLFLVKCTECISMLPYREDNSKLFQGFCPDAIKKKYKNSNEIWTSQLCMISGVSKSVASSIIMRYPTIKSLYDDYYKPGMTDQQRVSLLKDLKIESSNKKLGPVLSSRIFQIFCGKDPNQLVK
ncbi:hypothetical protein PPL_03595 [Heterostelium album PN500]|uniref:Uncharacterized protein n=1 Tax=Heterostelium pallidum (strain ATCC 26659 / Pp 5 / PN500) TaxID=670386 RepID=D3B582_HETP5|nr:hypothetical protein PPL_03595 [Heterostelium album PN500]EFA83447.1 hypothetical protein PPL_03595 [Heterostelium album PN500]|eukprot:XP_020435564.1 hypothetical protein PPL_03595 [Heterostelium album PN500]